MFSDANCAAGFFDVRILGAVKNDVDETEENVIQRSAPFICGASLFNSSFDTGGASLVFGIVSRRAPDPLFSMHARHFRG
jgi:hypothetical protein